MGTHIKTCKSPARSMEFCRNLRSLYPPRRPYRDRLRQLQFAPNLNDTPDETV